MLHLWAYMVAQFLYMFWLTSFYWLNFWVLLFGGIKKMIFTLYGQWLVDALVFIVASTCKIVYVLYDSLCALWLLVGYNCRWYIYNIWIFIILLNMCSGGNYDRNLYMITYPMQRNKTSNQFKIKCPIGKLTWNFIYHINQFSIFQKINRCTTHVTN